jgi:hypothetical protein
MTVKFQAHPGSMAGGMFGCRIVKRGEELSVAETLLNILLSFLK